MPTTTYITATEAAEMLGITPQAVYRLAKRGTLPERREGPDDRPTVTFPLPAVIARMEAQAQQPISQAAFEEYTLAETGTDDIHRLTTGEIRTHATEFITGRRSEWADDELAAWVNAITLKLRREQTS